MTNLEEFLFGGNPIVANKSIIPLQARIEKMNAGNDSRAFAILEVLLNRAAAQSVQWQLLTSADGATWTDANPVVEFLGQAEMANGMERRRYRVQNPLPDNSARMRLFTIKSKIEN